MDNREGYSNPSSLNVLVKVSSQLNWLVFSVLIISGTNFFILYNHHFGSLKWAVKREKANLERVKTNEAFGIPRIDIENSIKEYEDADAKLDIITLPLVGIPLFKRDFVILYIIIGIIFLFWIFTLIKYVKNFLENLVNDFFTPTDTDANTISSAFFLIMPTDYTSRRYRYFEGLYILFSLNIFFLILSDVYDIFFQFHLYNLPLSQNPSFAVMTPHLVVSYLLIFFCLVVSLYLFQKSKRTVRHIRNLLFLLRWNRVAFFPVLYYLAEDKEKPLQENQNFIEYRKCDDSGRTKLLLILNFEGAKTSYIVSAEVDLQSSSRLYFRNHGKESYTPKIDKKIGRILTQEETFMRAYFKAILTDRSYEKDLYQDSPFRQAL